MLCITPYKDDFISYGPSKVKVRDLSKTNHVVGEGLVSWSFLTPGGKTVQLQVLAYHIPNAEVRLPSSRFGHLWYSQAATFSLGTGQVIAAPVSPTNNLPLLHPAPAGGTSSFWSSAFDFDPISQTTCANSLSVMSELNSNLSAAQKEVLLWHQRLSHANVHWSQSLLRDRKWVQQSIDRGQSSDGAFIPCKRERAPVCDIEGLRCAACLMAKAHVRSPPSTKEVRVEKEMKLRRDHLIRGQCISANHYVSHVTGRLPHTFGREKHGYTGGGLYVDHATGKIFNFPQVSLTASETIRGKMRIEQEAASLGFSVKGYHSDNGIFASREFRQHCEDRQQQLSLSAPGTHHQNGIAERALRTVCQLARANLLHAAIHWPDAASVNLWPFALDYAVWIHNHLPCLDHGHTPDELWTESHSDHHDLHRAHIFGCPIYVLEPALQDGVFLGFSPLHLPLALLVLNHHTRKISPQYHVIFDDKFQTVLSAASDDELNRVWLKLFKRSQEFYLDEEVDANGKPTCQYPALDADWLNPDKVITHSLARDCPCHPRNHVPPSAPAPPLLSSEASDGSLVGEVASGGTDTVSEGVVDTVSEGVDSFSEGGVDAVSQGVDDTSLASSPFITQLYALRPRTQTFCNGPTRDQNFGPWLLYLTSVGLTASIASTKFWGSTSSGCGK
ncbi:LOW QUALITY PROTEIN: hypothetical protein ACHAXS_003697 [Conticribra weissflogii]